MGAATAQPPQHRRRTLALVVAAVVVAVAVTVAILLLGVSGSENAKPPPFHPGPGKVRLDLDLPGRGIPPAPKLVTAGSTRLFITFGDASTQGGKPVAWLSVSVPDEPGQSTSGHYGAGSVIRVDQVQVRVLAVYVEPNEDNDAVDLQITHD